VEHSARDRVKSKSSIPATRNGSKRVIRNKTNPKDSKHTDKISVKFTKLNNSRRKRQKTEKPESSCDSQADKENNMPTGIVKKKPVESKKGPQTQEKK
jgi:hypothetical protein